MSDKLTVHVSAEVRGRIDFDVKMTADEFERWDKGGDDELNKEMESRAPFEDLDVTDFEVDEFEIAKGQA